MFISIVYFFFMCLWLLYFLVDITGNLVQNDLSTAQLNPNSLTQKLVLEHDAHTVDSGSVVVNHKCVGKHVPQAMAVSRVSDRTDKNSNVVTSISKFCDKQSTHHRSTMSGGNTRTCAVIAGNKPSNETVTSGESSINSTVLLK